MESYLTEETYNRLTSTYNVIPVWKRINDTDVTPWDTYRNLPSGDMKILLESGKVGRYSYVAGMPRTVLSIKNGFATIQQRERQWQESCDSPLVFMKKWLQQYRAPRLSEIPFSGGWMGTLSYDLVRRFERLPQRAIDDLGTPELHMMEPASLYVFDHEQKCVYLVAISYLDEDDSYQDAWSRMEEMERSLQARTVALTPILGVPPTERAWSMSQTDFEAAVERIQEYIRAGDVFQVNLSLRENRTAAGVSPELMYDRLRGINPSPYMGIMEYQKGAIVSCSPELLVRLCAGEIQTRPIAGTRPRGINREEDLALARELIENEKERAEHVMMVDLERNDLGKVCEYGSVAVTEFMTIEEYSHVMHIVSHVNGRLRAEADSIDMIEATFPGGTITGAPKIRTMEIIEELEPVRRGIYTGSMGWISYSGDLELNITIRTMVFHQDQVYVQAGAGVVIDSVPAKEYEESLRKATALWKAFESCFEDGDTISKRGDTDDPSHR